MLDVTCGNSYQGADFWTYDSTGHLIRYFAGCYLRRGLFISKSDGPGYTEDVMYNPHFSARLPKGIVKAWEGDAWGPTIDFIWRNQEGIVFGRCDEEWVARTFLFASYAGMKFADDNGGMRGQVVNHGTDAGSVGVLFEATSEEGVDLYNTQLVHFGPVQKCAIETSPELQRDGQTLQQPALGRPDKRNNRRPGQVAAATDEHPHRALLRRGGRLYP